jgi:pimeloyl-ACP methyl ester carboxylesterase
MRRRFWAACLAVAVFGVAGQPAGRLELYAGEPGPAERLSAGVKSLPMPTLGGMQFWADELFFHEWRIQRNAITGHCRLLDGNLLRHASGSYEQCLRTLDEIKRQRNLPPMQGKAVVLLHGLGDTRLSMARLGKHLERHGGYTVFNVVYPSTRGSVADHARSLANVIHHLEGIEEIHLVGLSLGNIVIRHYLADHTDEATGRRPDPRIKRFVMLGPPNHGSIAATDFGKSRLFNRVLGEPGQELGRHWTWLESSLAVPQCPFGIIAGGLDNEAGFNPLLPGDDDGVVTVASTRLAGASDFIVVPVLHPLLPTDPKVMQYTLSFLQHGYFVSEDKRAPVAGD